VAIVFAFLGALPPPPPPPPPPPARLGAAAPRPLPAACARRSDPALDKTGGGSTGIFYRELILNLVSRAPGDFQGQRSRGGEAARTWWSGAGRGRCRDHLGL
jgi:hypothetical protein